MANERARSLRKSLTRQEVKIWNHLRAWRTRGFHFRRQAPKDGYILDFVCLPNRLIIEVDGGQHGMPHQTTRDKKRDISLQNLGFTVMRIWNSDVDQNLDGVLEAIDQALKRPHPAAFGGHPPPSGEG